MSWKRAVHALLHELERGIDAVKSRIPDPAARSPVLIPYRGHGTPSEIHVRGRVLLDPGLREPDPGDSLVDNAMAMLRRFESDEVPGAVVRARLADRTVETTTDEEGRFRFVLRPDAPVDTEAGWLDVPLELAESDGGGAMARARVPGPDARLGVISDVDDTVLRTNATSILAMATLTLLENARTRKPFEGVAALYRAFEAGASGAEGNPVFYVSSSPWNLYDLLRDFMRFQEIPAGPLFLQDLGIDEGVLLKAAHAAHKERAIEEILRVHHHLPFVLVGDSGQRDPEIYRTVVRRHPGRILAVYIRDVVEGPRRKEVREMESGLQHDVPLVLTEDSAAAAEHAASLGLLAPSAVEAVREEVARDEARPTPREKAANPDAGADA